MSQHRSYARFPGRAAVLVAVKEAGTWTARDVFAWARCNGGSEETYAALAWFVKRGKLGYANNAWFVPR